MTGGIRTVAPIERASAIDMMEWATATTPAAGQVGAVLVLEPPAVRLAEVRAALARRIQGVPRLRQRLRPTPPGCGRPIWVDHEDFDIAEHVGGVTCPPPGDRAALLAVAADLVARRLPPERPLWSATFVEGLTGGASALVVVFHHVMADGMGGLAVLASLVDGSTVEEVPGFPRPAPSSRALFVDALRSRLGGLTRLGSIPSQVRAAVAELGARPPSAPRTSLNEPVGVHRCLAVAETPLEGIRTASRARGVKVNDAVLAAVTGALVRFLADRGEAIEDLVVSIPVAAREGATATGLGNQLGVMAVQLPGDGPPGARMEAIGSITRSRKQGARGASAALLAPMFRLLAATRTLRWFTDHQHVVNTFVTNLRGPDSPIRFLDRKVGALLPIGSTSGNVGVAFGVFSYAGALTVTVVADGALRNDLDTLAGHLQAELDAIAETTG